MRDPQIGDIWRWCWDDGIFTSYSTCLITQRANKRDFFICLELESGESSLWTFAEEEMSGWEYLS